MCAQGYLADGVIALAGCDKSVPAAAMPLARTNAVGLALYGGTAWAGSCAGCSNSYGGPGLDAKDVFEVREQQQRCYFSSNPFPSPMPCPKALGP